MKQSKILTQADRLRQGGAAPVTRSLPLRRILVPLDFSGRSRRALDFAVPLARSHGAKIILLHVVQPAYVTGLDGFQQYVPLNLTDILEASRTQLKEMSAKYIEPALLDRAIVRQGVPWREITSAARRLKVDLIALTTQGHTGLAHALLGSTAERVVRHAPCAVLTVPRR